MEQVNIKSVIVAILNEFKADGTLKKIATDYPKSWNDFPTAIYRTSSKPHFTDANQNELQTQWNITIELYHNKSLTDITKRLNERFSDVRIYLSEKDGNTADLRRVILEAEFIVDNTLKIICEK
ncbi:hypothetical protein P7H41_13160 [Vagococcus fluvialis]|uniref:hypothetical protein n=1 Tax=Vagococcus fluvialis TaxID=2738 RepID=UPI002890BF06|nr:hypothetical protein [Vagococcus fluvialis]MDT2782892.1 hypothetical protein [Vagococcus fluvialis]